MNANESDLSGCEWVVEAMGCDAASLRDMARLRRMFDRLIEGLSLHPVEPPCWHQFPGAGGVTGLSLLAESHIACHTFPEYAASAVRVRKLERPYTSE